MTRVTHFGKTLRQFWDNYGDGDDGDTTICAMVVIKVVSRSSKAGFSQIIDEGSIVMQTMPSEAQICSLGSSEVTLP